MKVFRNKDDTSVLEFHKGYGSFVEFNDKIKEIKEALEVIEEEFMGVTADE